MVDRVAAQSALDLAAVARLAGKLGEQDGGIAGPDGNRAPYDGRLVAFGEAVRGYPG